MHTRKLIEGYRDELKPLKRISVDTREYKPNKLADSENREGYK